MSTTLPLDKYEELLRRSGLIEAGLLDRLLSEFRGQDQQGVNSLAAKLMKAGLITPWQNDKLLQGKARGFFLGKYKLLSHLTKGGMSDVFLAESPAPEKRKVAVKIFPPHLIEQASYLERFKQEARTQSEMDHPHIVKALDFGHEGKIYFYVMEYVEGYDLNRLVELKGPLGYKLACEYMIQASEALSYAHELGMVHRDIKPANLMLNAAGRVKLLDLGLARVLNEEVGSLTLKHNENSLGTADYVAPEQAIDSHNVDERADIYSLGGTFYYLLMGNPPFPEGTPVQRMMAHMNQDPAPLRTKRPDAPAELQAIILKMMSKKPDDRFPKMTDVKAALDGWCKSADGTAPQSGGNAAPTKEMGSAAGTPKPPAPRPAAAPAAARTPAGGQPAVTLPIPTPGPAQPRTPLPGRPPQPAAGPKTPQGAVPSPPKSAPSQPAPAQAAPTHAAPKPAPARTAPAPASAPVPAAAPKSAPSQRVAPAPQLQPAANSPVAAEATDGDPATDGSSVEGSSFSIQSMDAPAPTGLRRPAALPTLGPVIGWEFLYAMSLGLTAGLVPVALKNTSPAVAAGCGLVLGAIFTMLRLAFLIAGKR